MVTFKNCRCLIQSPQGRPDQRKEDFHKCVVSCSLFITSVLKLLLKTELNHQHTVIIAHVLC